jgi:predicted DsbA family dithiol-disulfide isomerase
LESALESFDGAAAVELTWHSFELDPGAPAAHDGTYAERLARKYGRTAEDSAALLGSMREMAQREGLDLRFGQIRGGNTFDGHRLIALALAEGRQGEMKERLMHAYFSEGALVSDAATLRRLAVETGLSAERVDELLAGDAFSEQVRVDEYTAQRLGIDAVPFFILDRRLAVRGALDSEQMLGALEQAALGGASPPDT